MTIQHSKNAISQEPMRDAATIGTEAAAEQWPTPIPDCLTNLVAPGQASQCERKAAPQHTESDPFGNDPIQRLGTLVRQSLPFLPAAMAFPTAISATLLTTGDVSVAEAVLPSMVLGIFNLIGSVSIGTLLQRLLDNDAVRKFCASDSQKACNFLGCEGLNATLASGFTSTVAQVCTTAAAMSLGSTPTVALGAGIAASALTCLGTVGLFRGMWESEQKR